MSQKFTQICIPMQEHGATGELFVSLILPLARRWLASVVVVSDVDAVGPTRSDILAGANEVRVLPTEGYLDLLAQATQIVWATLFFCPDAESANQLRGEEDYTESLSNSIFLARVVDATYFYIYFDGERPLDLEHPLFRGAQIKSLKLQELEFPE